tara:strand:+ start:15 stop:383 length:369 start_codon:yes stop_codon:yes gene_type:complete
MVVECSICFDTIVDETKLNKCGHTFHYDCIKEWFDINQTCPICREDTSPQFIQKNLNNTVLVFDVFIRDNIDVVRNGLLRTLNSMLIRSTIQNIENRRSRVIFKKYKEDKIGLEVKLNILNI